MKVSARRILIYSLGVVLIAVGLGFGARQLIFSLAKKKIIARVAELRTQGIDIQYDSLFTSAWNCNLCVKNIVVRVAARDTACAVPPLEATIASLEVSGLRLLPLLTSKKLSLRAITIQRPDIKYTQQRIFTEQKDNTKQTLKSIEIDSLTIIGGTFALTDSGACEASVQLISESISFTGLQIDELDTKVNNITCNTIDIQSAIASLPQQFYTVKMKKFGFDRRAKQLQIDSVVIKPTLDKPAFAARTGHQTDRIEGIIPMVRVSQLDLTGLNDSTFAAQAIHLSFALDVYRDKRYARIHRKPSVLPATFIHQLPFQVQIDSVVISNSDVSYEEFPEAGDEPGHIFFKDLTSTITHISNTGDEPAQMHAAALLMGHGKLNVDFTFPSRQKAAYTAKGTLRDFNLPEVNAMLRPLANAEVKSGVLDEMAFNFVYNEYRADGELVMNYRDLQLTSLKKKSEKDDKSNKLMTFLLNLFVKKDMDEKTAADKKTGTIEYYRDDQRAIFNYWWKSLLSGIKSVYNMDKITNADGKKNAK